MLDISRSLSSKHVLDVKIQDVNVMNQTFSTADVVINSSQVHIVPPKTATEIQEKRLLDELEKRFGKQEASQYINLILIPTVLRCRDDTIIDIFYADELACKQLATFTSNATDIRYVNRDELVRDAEVRRLTLTTDHRILVTIDGKEITSKR